MVTVRWCDGLLVGALFWSFWLRRITTSSIFQSCARPEPAPLQNKTLCLRSDETAYSDCLHSKPTPFAEAPRNWFINKSLAQEATERRKCVTVSALSFRAGFRFGLRLRGSWTLSGRAVLSSHLESKRRPVVSCLAGITARRLHRRYSGGN